MKDCYEHPAFRQFKFLVYCKTKASENEFMSKIKKTFSKANKKSKPCETDTIASNASKGTKKIVLEWGNWGKNPNALKNNAPTPGIGIRKRFEGFFRTEKVDDHNTSQTCPCCQNRSLKAQDIPKEKFTIHKHHLLHRTNEDCHSRWWSRNVVGSFNILKRILDSYASLGRSPYIHST